MLIPIFGIFLVMIPVAGLTLTLTLRFAGKPFVETLAQALRESGSLGSGSDPQIEALSEAYLISFVFIVHGILHLNHHT